MKKARHLSLKWRDEDQFGCVFGETMRVPSEHRQLLEDAGGQLCTIYIPRHGAPFSALPGMAHVAVTRLGKITERMGSHQLLVELSGTQFLPFPVRQRSDHPIDLTAGTFPPRDHSAEQFAVREIDRRLLAEILRSSNMPNGRFKWPPSGLMEQTTDAPEYDDSAADAEVMAARRREAFSRTLRDRRLRRQAIRADDGRCVVTGWRSTFRGQLVGLEAAHVRAVASRGSDTVSNICLMHVLYHDLFDRFAFTIGDDFQVIWSRHYDPSDLQPPPLRTGKIRMGLRLDWHQVRANLRWHQEHFWRRENRGRSA